MSEDKNLNIWDIRPRGNYTSITTGSIIGLRLVFVNKNCPIWSRIGELLIVVVYINYFYGVAISENKNCPILSVNAETPDFHVMRLQKLCFKSGMEYILFKKELLFFKLLPEVALPQIRDNIGMERQNAHN